MTQRVAVGKIVGIHGLLGWLKLHSYCEPRTKIFEYKPLYFGSHRFEQYEGKKHGKGLLVRLDDLKDRTAVEHLLDCDITVERHQLAPLRDSEFYWHDLIGLVVENQAGDQLGRVKRVMPTGANDVLVVEGRQRLLIPFVLENYVKKVNLETGRIVVDWGADWI